MYSTYTMIHDLILCILLYVYACLDLADPSVFDRHNPVKMLGRAARAFFNLGSFGLKLRVRLRRLCARAASMHRW